jgi:hypothetical protein
LTNNSTEAAFTVAFTGIQYLIGNWRRTRVTPAGEEAVRIEKSFWSRVVGVLGLTKLTRVPEYPSTPSRNVVV